MCDWRTILAIDHDKWACETYRANGFADEVICGSVAELIPSLPDADVILAGPPCQGHSLAGKRLASKDERDGGADFVAAVRKVKPRAFLMENVAGMLSSENGRYYQNLYRELEQSGYAVQHRVLDAVNFGVPQFRVRVWTWGIRSDVYASGVRHLWPKLTHAWPPPDPCMFGAALLPGVTVGAALGLDGVIERGQRGRGLIERHGDRPTSPTSEPAPTVGAAGSGSSQLYFQSHADPPQPIDQPSPAVDAGWKRRRLTPLECARLQSVPDSFIWPDGLSKANAYKIIGNGWACAMASAMSETMKKSDPKAEMCIDLYCGGGLGACGWHGRFWSME